jgi:hypothetical protein
MIMSEHDNVYTPRSKYPAWLIEEIPVWALPYVGIEGLHKLFGVNIPQPPVKNIDIWQSNHNIIYRPEIENELYNSYTPLIVNYIKGTLPSYEKLAAKFTAGLATDREKAVALLTKAMPGKVMHPTDPPLGLKDLPPDRGLDDEDLLESGYGWCNEQARVFVRLCQVSGIPARMVFLQFGNGNGGVGTNGHVIAEFYADGGWCMADASWFTVFPGFNGKLMSALQCHQPANSARVGEAYIARWKELLTWTDDQLCGHVFKGDTPAQSQITDAGREERNVLKNKIENGYKHFIFSVLNYPLPY